MKPDKSFLLLASMASATVIIFVRYLMILRGGGVSGLEDFGVFFTAGQKAFHGQIHEVYNTTLAAKFFKNPATNYHPYINPPVLLLFLMPLGLFSYYAGLLAWLVWIAPPLILLVFFFWVMKKNGWFPALSAMGNRYYYCVMVILLLPSLLITSIAGQAGFLTAALLVGGLVSLRPLPLLSGFFFGLLIIKPQLGLLVPVALVAGGHWRAFIAAAATALLSVLVTIYLWGGDIWREFFQAIQGHMFVLAHTPPGWLRVIMSPYAAIRLYVSSETAMGVQAFILFLLIVIVWKTFARHRNESLRAAVLISASACASPYIFTYDLPMLVIPLAWMVNIAMREGLKTAERIIVLLAAFVPLIGAQLNDFHIPLGAVANLGLCICCYQRSRSEASD